MAEEIFLAHTRTWHCQILISEGHDPNFDTDFDTETASVSIKREPSSGMLGNSADQPAICDDVASVYRNSVTTPCARSNQQESLAVKAESTIASADDSDLEIIIENLTADTVSDAPSAELVPDDGFPIFTSSDPFTNCLVQAPIQRPRFGAGSSQSGFSNDIIRRGMPAKRGRPRFDANSQRLKHASLAPSSISHKIPAGQRGSFGYSVSKRGGTKKSFGRTFSSSAMQKASPVVSGGEDDSSRRVVTGFACKWCDKVYPTMYRVRRHERIHTDEKPYLCEICPKPFRYGWQLKMHNNRFHSS